MEFDFELLIVLLILSAALFYILRHFGLFKYKKCCCSPPQRSKADKNVIVKGHLRQK